MTRCARGLAALITVAAGCMLANPAMADNFFTNFETGSDHTNPNAPFTAVDGGLAAEFSGGTVLTIGVRRLYRSGDRSWMIDAGNTRQIAFSRPATSVTFWAINERPNEVATVQFLDSGDTVLSEQNVTSSGGFVEITLARNTGDANVARVTVQNMGTGMVAIDDVSFSTDPPGGLTTGDSGSSSLSALVLPLLIVPAWWRRARRLSVPG